jgi:hypothetical protein
MTQCLALTPTGKRCRNPAIVGSNPPLCRSHHPDKNFGSKPPRLADDYDPVAPQAIVAPHPPAGDRQPHLYNDYFTDDELSRLLAVLSNPPLGDEVAVTRLTLARLLSQLSADPGLTVSQVLGLAPLVFEGARTVGRLLRDQQAISGETADKLAGIVAQVLKELGEELGLAL